MTHTISIDMMRMQMALLVQSTSDLPTYLPAGLLNSTIIMTTLLMMVPARCFGYFTEALGMPTILTKLPWRKSKSVRPDLRLYAVGDVHGRADALRDVFARIDA